VTVDVQIVAASNRNLTDRIAAGEFRSDLYHRLSVFELVLPSLSERIGDLDELVPQIISEFNSIAGKDVHDVSDEVWRALKAHSWPGNVRELRNVIERCVLFSEGPTFPERWLQLPGQTPVSPSESDAGALTLPLDGSLSLEEMEAHIIRVALERSDYNATAAARSLGTTRQKLRYRAQKHGIRAPNEYDGTPAD
jgi:transcriptional regulator with PAS, ATPase and Fis domain